jgi:hypothetical protein
MLLINRKDRIESNQVLNESKTIKKKIRFPLT